MSDHLFSKFCNENVEHKNLHQIDEGAREIINKAPAITMDGEDCNTKYLQLKIFEFVYQDGPTIDHRKDSEDKLNESLMAFCKEHNLTKSDIVDYRVEIAESNVIGYGKRMPALHLRAYLT